MVWPEIYRDFHRTIQYKKIRKELQHQHQQASLTVLHGKSGFGKSSMALALVDDLSDWHEKKVPITSHVKCFLISSTQETLSNGMTDFCKEKNLEPRGMEFDEIVECLNSKAFARKMKWFVFDDMDMSALFTERFRCSIKRLQEDGVNRTKWRIIITTKQGVPEFANHDVRVNQFQLNGFTSHDSLQFFGARRAMKPHVEKLQDGLSGSPLALRVAKNCFTDLSKVDDDLMENLEQRALKASVCDHDQKEIVVFLEWIIRNNFEISIIQDLLGCIAFFDENNISDELLHSCMEALKPNMSLIERKKRIENFQEEIASFRLTTQKPKSIHTYIRTSEKLDITIHQLTREAMRISFHEDPGVEKYLCRSAMTALTRCLDIDGRFSGAASENVAHAEQLVKLLRTKPDAFLDHDMKLMVAELLYASAYADLKRRSSSNKGLQTLKEARDFLCKWLTGIDYAALSENHGQNGVTFDPKRVGEKLYNACKMMPQSRDYQSYVKDVQLYRRLTKRDLSVLNLTPEDTNNEHLKASALSSLRDNEGALGEKQFIKLFAAECVALVFYLIARVPSFLADDEHVDEAICCAEVTRSMYDQIESDHKVLVLNKVLVRREELQSRLDLMMRSDQLDPANGHVEATQKILDAYDDLLRVSGDAYEYGLRRSKLDKDNYHKMVCYEGMLLCRGWLVRFGETAAQKELSKEKGMELYKRCRSVADSETRKYYCLSNVEESYATFLHICKEPPKEVCKALVDAITHLENAIHKENKQQLVVQQGRFSKLCSMLKKYVPEPVDLDVPTRRVLKRLINDCDQTGREELGKILNDVKRQKMQPTDE